MSAETPDRSRLVAAMETATLAAIGHRERADRLEIEVGALRDRIECMAQEAERSAAGYEAANKDMHRAMVKAIRERDYLRIELREARR